MKGKLLKRSLKLNSSTKDFIPNQQQPPPVINNFIPIQPPLNSQYIQDINSNFASISNSNVNNPNKKKLYNNNTAQNF